MTPTSFLQHWAIVENPFRAEEARQDAVLRRLGTLAGEGVHAAQHPDFEKIVGDLEAPSSAVAFGEKGSGKTAMRLQMARLVAQHNLHPPMPGSRVLLIAYDDLNPVLASLHGRLARATRKGESNPTDTLKQMRLADHVDGLLGAVVPPLLDAILESDRRVTEGVAPDGPDLGPRPRQTCRRMEAGTKRDLLTLQVLYDRAGGAGERTRLLRRVLGVRLPLAERIETVLAAVGWVLPLGAVAALHATAGSPGAADGDGVSSLPEIVIQWADWLGIGREADGKTIALVTAFFVSLGLWLVFLLRRAVTERLSIRRTAGRLWRSVRATGRGEASFASSLRQAPDSVREAGVLPLREAAADESRLAMLQRLVRVLKPFGYGSVVVVVDRLDEPSLVAGDAERMRAVAWPLLSNKLLQQEGVAFKMLLPIELRHMLFRESAAFFQTARMDKHNLVEDLAWTGAMLYDLCNARIAACRAAGATPVTLADLFEPEVGREALVDALETMRQPRDAMRLVYRCIAEHCASVTEDSELWTISKRTLDAVRKGQAERVRQLAMGVRPG